jgi:hypothetical protein
MIDEKIDSDEEYDSLVDSMCTAILIAADTELVKKNIVLTDPESGLLKYAILEGIAKAGIKINDGW